MAKAAHMQSLDVRAQLSSLDRKLDQVNSSISAIRDPLRGLSSAKTQFQSEYVQV
jgi:prefoldin subunit 5